VASRLQLGWANVLSLASDRAGAHWRSSSFTASRSSRSRWAAPEASSGSSRVARTPPRRLPTAAGIALAW